MFRLWAKTFKNNKMLNDMVVEDAGTDTRTHKIFHAIDEICTRNVIMRYILKGRLMQLTLYNLKIEYIAMA